MTMVWPCAAAATMMLSACSAAPAADTGSQVRQATPTAAVSPGADTTAPSALRAAIDKAFAPSDVRQEDHPARQARRVVSAQVDPALLRGAVAVDGVDVRFTPADGLLRHAGVLVLRYPDAALATTKLGARTTGFFHATKILTPMVMQRSGATIAIFFTESGGDPVVRAMLSDAAKRHI